VVIVVDEEAARAAALDVHGAEDLALGPERHGDAREHIQAPILGPADAFECDRAARDDDNAAEELGALCRRERSFGRDDEVGDALLVIDAFEAIDERATHQRDALDVRSNDYKKEDGEQTFGLLFQISPDGRYGVSTVDRRRCRRRARTSARAAAP